MVEAYRSPLISRARPCRAAAATESDPARRSWIELLENTIEAEILPALLSAQQEPQFGAAAGEAGGAAAGYFTPADIDAFVTLILADELEEARAIVDRVIVQTGGRETLLGALLTPAARYLGLLWERDLCDFMDVTLGVYRLDLFMRETEFADGQKAVLHQHEHRALLLPAPGEQHSFGIGMVADVFRGAGWCVRSGPAVARHRLVRLVRDEWFDIVGLSISSERFLGSLATCIRMVRQASCNQNLVIMIGGHAIVGHEERSRFLGADMVAIDADQALELSNGLVANLAERPAAHPFRQSRLT